MPTIYLPADSRNLPQSSTAANFTTTPSWTCLSATVPDLDGNTLRLLHVLVRLGYLSPISQENWQTILKLYDKGKNIDCLDFENFYTILEANSVHNGSTPNSPALLRLIGDTLCDLGRDEDSDSQENTSGNDGLTLLVYKFLHNKNIPFEILASNHDMEFLDFYAKYRFNKDDLKKAAFRLPRKNYSALNFLINTGGYGHYQYSCYMSDKELNALIKIYLKHLKIFSYEKTKDRLALYAHSPTSISDIQYAADFFKVNLKPDPIELRQTEVGVFSDGIDVINKEFIREVCTAIEKGDLKDIYDNNAPLYQNQNQKPTEKSTPMQTIVARAAWKRGVSEEEENSNAAFEKKADIKLDIYHGHEHHPNDENAGFLHRVPVRYHNLEDWKNNTQSPKCPTIELGEPRAVFNDETNNIILEDTSISKSSAVFNCEKNDAILKHPSMSVYVGVWCIMTVAAAALPVGIYAATGATVLGALTIAWPIMLAIVVGSVVLGTSMHCCIFERTKNNPEASNLHETELTKKNL